MCRWMETITDDRHRAGDAPQKHYRSRWKAHSDVTQARPKGGAEKFSLKPVAARG
jgi:hypothetical protein